MRIQGYTNIGKRKVNQDAYWGAELLIDGHEVRIALVCDGMGGLSKGELASKLVVDSVRDYCLAGNTLSKEGIISVLNVCNTTLRNLSEDNERIGTTCVLVINQKGRVWQIWSIGDTRAYRCKKESLTRLTEDHTVLKMYESKGVKITEEIKKKYRGLLTRCIGVAENINVDYKEYTFAAEDVILLASDGFWHFLTENELKDITSIDGLVKMTKRFESLGELDNMTALVIGDRDGKEEG